MADADADAAILLSGKRQGDPPAGDEEEQDAKKLNLGEEEEQDAKKLTLADKVEQAFKKWKLDKAKESSSFLPQHIIDDMSDEYLEHIFLERADLRLTMGEIRERMTLNALRSVGADDPEREVEPYDPPATEELPKGYGWASYDPGSGSKDFITKMFCVKCGEGLDHWYEDCPQTDSLLLQEYLEAKRKKNSK